MDCFIKTTNDWKRLSVLQEGLLVAVANSAWDEVSELAKKREELIKKIMKQESQVQEATSHKHLQRLLDFNGKIIVYLEKRKTTLAKKSNVIQLRKKANAAYLGFDNAS